MVLFFQELGEAVEELCLTPFALRLSKRKSVRLINHSANGLRQAQPERMGQAA
jgi:hypothetical protein